jgi:arsenate reductase
VSLLKEHKIEFTIIEYLKSPLTVDEVITLSKKLKKSPGEMVRKNEADFKENSLGTFINDEKKMADAISQFPKIMERPIAVLGDNAIIGRPPENVLTLLTGKENA